MDNKKSALQKIEAILNLGRPKEPDWEGVPDDVIAPERMARLKARCSKIAPFKPKSSDKDVGVVAGKTKIPGLTVIVKKYTSPDVSKNFGVMMDKLVAEKNLKKVQAELIRTGLASGGDDVRKFE